jgi:hypothetical protein
LQLNAIDALDKLIHHFGSGRCSELRT